MIDEKELNLLNYLHVPFNCFPDVNPDESGFFFQCGSRDCVRYGEAWIDIQVREIGVMGRVGGGGGGWGGRREGMGRGTERRGGDGGAMGMGEGE